MAVQGLGAELPKRSKIAYWKAIPEVGEAFDVAGTSFGVTQACRRAAQRNDDVAVFALAADRWIRTAYGRVDDRLRRAALASAALDLNRRSRALPPVLVAHQVEAHRLLAEELDGPNRLSSASYTRDAAFVTGLAAPAGAMSVFVPPPGLASAMLAGRRLVGQTARKAAEYTLQTAADWLREVGARRWAALHLDERYTACFNAPGLKVTFDAAAAVLNARPDLAGLYGASWFFDPALARVSPRLGFLRAVAEAGGASFLRLPTSEAQQGFALATSPTRRRAYTAGYYRPTCYGLYWPAAQLTAWSKARACGRMAA